MLNCLNYVYFCPGILGKRQQTRNYGRWSEHRSGAYSFVHQALHAHAVTIIVCGSFSFTFSIIWMVSSDIQNLDVLFQISNRSVCSRFFDGRFGSNMQTAMMPKEFPMNCNLPISWRVLVGFLYLEAGAEAYCKFVFEGCSLWAVGTWFFVSARCHCISIRLNASALHHVRDFRLIIDTAWFCRLFLLFSFETETDTDIQFHEFSLFRENMTKVGQVLINFNPAKIIYKH
jgi:hypothetical protein